MRSGDQLVCALVAPLNVGYQFKDWPPHVTIVPWFRPKVQRQSLLEYLQGVVYDERPFTARAGKQTRIVIRRVNMLEPGAWQSLHEKVLEIVDRYGKNTAPLRLVGQRYRPHITVQKNGRSYEGDTFLVDKLYLVEQHSSYKTIVGEIVL